MKFNVNIKKGISVTLVFEGENIDNKVLEYVKEKELFTGKSGEIYSYLPFDGEKQILVGLGKKEELKEDEVREVFFKVVKVLLTNKELEAQIELPNLDRIGKNIFVKALVEGALHATYKFDKYKSDRKELPETLYRTLAKSYVEQEKLIKAYNEAEHGEVASVSDNGQSISYKSKKESMDIENIKNNVLNNIESILDQYKKKIKVVGEDEYIK